MGVRFFQCQYATLRLWVANFSTSVGNKLAIKEYSRGDLPDVRNQGNQINRTRVALQFDDMFDDDMPPDERLLALIALKDQKKPQTFVHPISGRYLAEIEDFDYNVDASGTITATATFVATEEVGAVVVAPIGVSLEVDSDALNAASENLQAQLDDFEITSTIPTDATALASKFSDAQRARDILVGVSQLSDRLWTEVADLKLDADIAMWPLLSSYVQLGEALRAAGVAATPQVDSLITVRIDGPMSLWSFVQQTYGASNAEARRQDLMSINDIPTPARIPSGTVLRCPRP